MISISDISWAYFTRWFWSWNPKYNHRMIRCYPGIGSNIHGQKFVYILSGTSTDLLKVKQICCMTIECSVKEIHQTTLQWRHIGGDDVSNHQPYDCLLNCLFRHRWKNISNFRVTGICVRGIHRWPVISPHKGSVTRKKFLSNDVIMKYVL